MDLSKAFDIVDHVILIKKLDHYGVKGRNFLWFKSYLNNRRQFITHDNSNTSFANISCGVLQGSILGPLLFLLYINDLPNASPVLAFSTVNMDLEKIGEWFKASKLSLTIKKTNYTLFHKNSTKDDLSLKLPDLGIINSVF